MAYTHRTWHVRIWQTTSSNDRLHQSGDIGRGLPASTVVCAHRSTDVGRGLSASAVDSANRSAFSGCCLPASPLALMQQSADVERGLPASPLALMQQSADVERGLPASPLAYTQRSADVRRGHPISDVACPDRLRPALVRRTTLYTMTLVATALVDNTWMLIPYKNQKSVKHPSCITTYSYIFYLLFSTFSPHVVHSYQSSLLFRFVRY